MANHYGSKLNPYRRLREPHAAQGLRQSVCITNNPSTIDANQQLLVRFPNPGKDDVIVPGTVRLAFKITLNSKDPNVTVVQNLGRNIVKKIVIRISGNEVLSVDDADLFFTYMDLWLTANERKNRLAQGLDTERQGVVNKLRVNPATIEGSDAAKMLAKIYKNRFHIPLDFELLQTGCPFYQAGLGDRLEYELTFNDYSRAIRAKDDPESTYKISDICLEFDVVTHPDLANHVGNQYAGRMGIYYDRIHRHRKIVVDASDALWNININVPCRSLRGVLILFEYQSKPFERHTEYFYNPKISKIQVTVEGVPNQLYSAGMQTFHQWEEIQKFFAAGYKRDPITAAVCKDLGLTVMTDEEYFFTRYALWLDLRTTDDAHLHGSGRQILNASEGLTLHIEKVVETTQPLTAVVFLIQDAQLILEAGRYSAAIY